MRCLSSMVDIIFHIVSNIYISTYVYITYDTSIYDPAPRSMKLRGSSSLKPGRNLQLKLLGPEHWTLNPASRVPLKGT